MPMRTSGMKSFAITPLPLTSAALVALLCAACGRLEPQTADYVDGPACPYQSQSACPYAQGRLKPAQGQELTNVPLRWSQERGAYIADIPADSTTVYVFLNGDTAARRAAPVVAPPVAAPALPPPVLQPVALENPFEETRTWRGKYICTQGLTDLAFRVTSVSGTEIGAIFQFVHVDSGAAGSYRMTGHYNPRLRTVSFEPGEWLEQPPNYVTISMTGSVSPDGSIFAGRIPHPGCSWFRLRPAP